MSFWFQDADAAPVEIQIVACEQLLRVLWERHQTATGSAGVAGVAPVNDFPGWITVCRGRMTSAMGATVEPDRTLSVTIPIFGSQASPSLQKQSLCLLLHEARLTARRKLLRGIHVLLPRDATTENQEALADWYATGGLPAVATIASMGLSIHVAAPDMNLPSDARIASAGIASARNRQKNPAEAVVPPVMEDEEDEDVRLELLSAVELLTCVTDVSSRLFDSRINQVRLLIQQCLENSDDLPAVCRPSVEDMVRMWIARNALVLVLHRAALPAAVCVLAVADASAQSASNSAVQTELTIEYLGVAPTQRRRGCARRMLQTVMRHASALARHIATADLPATEIPTSNIPEAQGCADDHRTADVVTGHGAQSRSVESAGRRQPRGVMRIRAFVDDANVAAVQLYESCGFVRQESFHLLFESLSESEDSVGI